MKDGDFLFLRQDNFVLIKVVILAHTKKGWYIEHLEGDSIGKREEIPPVMAAPYVQ